MSMTNNKDDKTLLYVDDEQENLDGFKFNFRKDYTIFTAQNTLEAFNIIRNHPIKVVLSDNKMPDMLGTEFFEILTVSNPEIIRILVTAYADTEAAMQAINKGQVYRFITKPWNKNELQVAIENAFEAYNLRAQNQQLIENLSKKNFELEDLNFRLMVEVSERRKVEEELFVYKNHLEQLVAKRTEEIENINRELRKYKEELETLVEERTKQLIESEKRLTTISNNLPGGAIFRGYTCPDNTDHLVYASAKITEIAGIELDKLLISVGNFFNKIYPEDIPSFVEARKKSLESLDVLDHELRIIKDNNEIRWLHLRMIYQKTNNENYSINTETLSMNAITANSEQKLKPVNANENIWWDGYVIDITDRKKAEEEAKQLETIINRIHEGISTHTGEKLLENITIKLAEVLNADMLYIAKGVKDNTFIKTLTLSQNYKIKPNIELPIKNSPCEQVIKKNISITIPANVTQLYPKCQVLKELNAEVYIGIPLKDSMGKNIGLLTAIYSHTLEKINYYERILEIFSTRIAAEIERIHSEEAIQQYSDVAYNMQVALNVFQLTDPNNNNSLQLIKANPAAAKIIGKQLNQILGKPFLQIYPQLANYYIQDILCNVIATGKPYVNEEFKIFSQKGNLLFYSFKAFPVPNQCVGVLFEDITRKKLAEQALKESEERYKALFEKSPNGIHLIGTKGAMAKKIVSANPAFFKMLGYSPEEIIGMPVEKFMVSNQNQNNIYMHIEDLMAGQTIIHEMEFRHKNGKIFPVEITYSIISFGDELYILGIDRDITEIKQAQQQLQENIHFLSTLLETIPLPVAYLNKERKYIGCNTEFERFTGQKRNQIIGKTVFDLYPPEYAQRYDESDKNLLENSNIQIIEEQTIDTEGNLKDIIITKSVFTDANDQIAGYIVTLFDITERKNIEQRLLETIITTEEKERERFAGNLHDEVGPLLSSLKMYLSLLSENDDKTKKEYILRQVQTLIKEAIQTVREISNDLSPHVLNNYGFIEAINSFISLKSDFIKIKCTHNIENKRYSANLETILYRITKELINNTIKHAQAQTIFLDVREENNLLHLYYHDDGKGFEINEKIEKKAGSIGLLNIVSRVKTINGKYQIKTAPNKGFTFELTIPLQS